MSRDLKSAIDAWHMAEADVGVAEAILLKAEETMLQNGQPVPPELIADVKRLRSKAADLLKIATDLAGPEKPKSKG